MSDQIETKKISTEKKREYNNKYYAKNKEKVLTKCKEKKLCNVCNKMISSSNFSKHIKNNMCIEIEDREKIKQDKKIKKIKELNEYIAQMNKLYETDVKLIDMP